MSEAYDMSKRKSFKETKTTRIDKNQVSKLLSTLWMTIMIFIPIQSFNIAFPMFSFATSCIVFGLFADFVYTLKNVGTKGFREDLLYMDFAMYNYAFLGAAAGCTVQIFHGFSTAKLSQYISWNTLKSTECGMLIGTITYLVVKSEAKNKFTETVIANIVLLAITVAEIIFVALKVAYMQRQLKIIQKVDNDKHSDLDSIKTLAIEDSE